MKVTFIRPNMFAKRSSDAMEPLCFAILKSLTPPGIDTALYDERIEPIPLDEPTDLVAMTVETYTARRAYQIAAEYRRRGIQVVMGGYHPTFLPNEALQFADAVVVGDAEGVWERLVDDATHHRLCPIYRQERFPPLEKSRPDRSIFKGKRYVPITLVQYGRGCKYHCDFCSIRAFYGNTLRQRPVDEVVEEIRRKAGKHLFIVDDNIFVDVPKAKELFAAMIPLNIRWSCQVSIDIAKDRELVTLMRDSGCTTAVIGFESLDNGNLEQMNKGWSQKQRDYETSITILQDVGIMIYGTFIFGYDGDTAASFDQTVDFAIRNKFYLANFNPLTPTPGAPLFERLRREKRLIHDKWWLEPAYRYGEATFHPKQMTADELTAGCYRARTRFNSYSSILRRALDWRTTLRSPYRLSLYIMSNLISKREIHSKQNEHLGESVPLPSSDTT